ncbi:MAG: SGNH/GDSL hydrolase family protein [Planctomycetales bacterium]
MSKRIGCGVAVLLLSVASTLNAGQISALLVFGDSLSDTGNLFEVTGKPPGPYFGGRFSNGILWHEHLAQKLGLPAATPSLKGGTNQAWAGAESGLGLSPLFVPNVLTQVLAYLLIQHTVSPTELVAIWAGGNDYLFGELVKADLPKPEKIANDIEAAILALTLAGGRQFLVPNLPFLGYSPLIRDKGAPGDAEKINNSVMLYNALLQTRLMQLENLLGIKIYQVDVATLFEEVRTDPAAYGLTNVTDAAFPDHVPQADEHLFWDYVHPTTRVHGFVADAAYASITHVPEPSSLTVAGVSLLLLGCRARRLQTRRVAERSAA